MPCTARLDGVFGSGQGIFQNLAIGLDCQIALVHRHPAHGDISIRLNADTLIGFTSLIAETNDMAVVAGAARKILG